jgi:hypothetical protein
MKGRVKHMGASMIRGDAGNACGHRCVRVQPIQRRAEPFPERCPEQFALSRIGTLRMLS